MQHDINASLPPPDADSAAHSERVADFIRGKIREAGGSISFAEFMQHALYAPGLGYYAAGAEKFGPAGDFVTAPEVSPVFGHVVARQCAEILEPASGGAILEIGAGSGRLAADVLVKLRELDTLPQRYSILEVSADLRERQERYLASTVPELLPRVNWLSSPPVGHRGVILANEVLDALPVERFVKRAGDVMQIRVESVGAAFRFVEAAAPAHLTAAVVGIESELGYALPDAYSSEVSLGLPGWVGGLADMLHEGIVLLFDYGVSRREFYAPARSAGWLRCHFRHHAHDDPLILPGIQDLTSWVDFTAVAQAAVSAELEVAGYVTQARFLLDGGLDEEMQSFATMPLEAQLALSREVKTLTLPGEMGEHFKCIALRRGRNATPSAFRSGDRTHTL